MSRTGSIYVVSMWFFFIFIFIFIMINRTNTETCSFAYFLEYVLLFFPYFLEFVLLFLDDNVDEEFE